MARGRLRKQVPQAVDSFRGNRLYWAALVLAVVGLAVSIYLTYLYYSGSETLACPAGSGCDSVRDSEFSSIIGIPVSLVGVIGYALLGIVALLPLQAGNKRPVLFTMALAGFAFAAYLTYREAFDINAFCPYCVVSAVVITAILVLVLLQRPVVPGWNMGTLALWGATVLVVVVVASVALPRGTSKASFPPAPDLSVTPMPGVTPTIPDTYTARLAQHLTKSGAQFFGAYWCSACATQKQLFGNDARFLPYVECDARGTNPQPARCQAANVRVYPTWIIRGAVYEGVQPLETLARLSGYTAASSTPTPSK